MESKFDEHRIFKLEAAAKVALLEAQVGNFWNICQIYFIKCVSFKLDYHGRIHSPTSKNLSETATVYLFLICFELF